MKMAKPIEPKDKIKFCDIFLIVYALFSFSAIIFCIAIGVLDIFGLVPDWAEWLTKSPAELREKLGG